MGNAVGMAMAERHLAARFGSDLVDHRTFVLCSDGDLEEGISHEACSLAGHYRLNRLIFLYDDNGISIDGPTSMSFSDDVVRRFEGYHWNATRVDGQDAGAVDRAIAAAMDSDRPTIIACKTTIGYGAPTKAGTEKAHGSPLGAKEIEGARKNLHWPYPPFEVPEPILSAWRDLREARGRGRGRLAPAPRGGGRRRSAPSSRRSSPGDYRPRRGRSSRSTSASSRPSGPRWRPASRARRRSRC